MARYVSNLPKIHFGMCYTEVTETGSSHSIAQQPSETGDQYLQDRYDEVQKRNTQVISGRIGCIHMFKENFSSND